MNNPLTACLALADGTYLVPGEQVSVVIVAHDDTDDALVLRRYTLGDLVRLEDLPSIVNGFALTVDAEEEAPQFPAPQDDCIACPDPDCARTFKNENAVRVHYGRMHKPPWTPPQEEAPVEPEPEPETEPPAEMAPGTRTETGCACGYAWRDHPRCCRCFDLIGPGHDTLKPIIINRKTYCEHCAELT